MSDDLIFREVDEDLRQDQLHQLWRKYGTVIVAGAVLIVVGVAGFKGWTWYQAREAAQSGARFEEALRLSDQEREGEAQKVLDGLIANGSGSYPLLARLVVAGQKAKTGDIDGAVAGFDAVAKASGDAVLRDLARVRAAMLLVDRADRDAVTTRVSDIAADGNPWRHSAREVIGLAAHRAGDLKAAGETFRQIAADATAPQDVRQRAELMLTLMAPEEKAAGTGEAGK